MKYFLFAFTLAAVGAGMGLSVGRGTFDRTLSVSGPAELDIRSDVGGIAVTVGSSESVEVHAVLKAEYGPVDLARAEANIRALEQNPPIERAGNHIRIGYPKDSSLLGGVSMHLDIQIPRDSQIEARTTSGGIRVEGAQGSAQARTHSGAISIQSVAGPILAQNESGGIRIDGSGGQVTSETSSGRIEILDSAGLVRATTHSGSISIHKAQGPIFARNDSGGIVATDIAGAIDAQASSGAIRLEQTTPAPIRAGTESGAIKVELGNRDAYTIDANSESGKIAYFGSKDSDRGSMHHLQENIGSGKPLVSLNTHSAKIEIE